VTASRSCFRRKRENWTDFQQPGSPYRDGRDKPGHDE
jgi:hypothetical protein